MQTVTRNYGFCYHGLKGHCYLPVRFFCKFNELVKLLNFEPAKKYYWRYVISHTRAVIVLSHNLATYEEAWNKASYWYELVDAF